MKTKFLQRVLWLVIPLLTMFNSQMYADAFEGFEYFSTSTSYTTQLDWSDDDADLDWRSQYGAVTTSSKRSGNNGFLLRNYKSNGNKGWLVTRTTVTNVTEITYYMKVTNTGVKHKVCYSTNGTSWTDITTNIGNSNTNWVSKTITVPAGVRASALYFRWEITSSNSTNSNRDLYIDDVTFTVDAGSVATPTFNNGTGTYNNNVSVTISTETDGAAIHYTTTGTAPTCSTGTTGTSVTISSTGTVLKAIACKDGSDDSEVATATYTLKCATPTGLATDTYVGTQTVTLATTTAGADIYYTTDGSNPTASSTHYTAPFSVSSTSTIKAIAIKSNYVNSDIASATYTITPAYVVTWKNQGTTVTTTNVASGSKPVFPDMTGESGCQTYTYFYGWAAGTWTGEVSSPGTSSTVKVYKSASEMPDVTGNVTYHAVWGDSPGGWSIVSSIAVDDVVVFAYTNGSSYYKELSGVSNSMGQVSDYSSTPSGLYPLTVCAGTASGYFAFKNGSNYLKGTTSNSLETETSVTDASSWSVSITNGVAEIENKANSGRKLKGNTSQYRIVNYNNNNANNINIWKQSASANCVTSCCNQLAAINGSVSSYTQTSVTLQWDKLSNVDGTTPYTVTCSPAGTVGSIDLSGAKATCTVTGLSCGTSYTFSITAHGTTGYCDKTQSGIAQTTSSYTVGYSVTNGSKTSGDATTCGPLTAVFSANSGYHLPDKAAITVTGASDFSWTKATGTLTITAGQITGNINISFTCPADACTDAFSLHTGTKGGSDWLYNKCFTDADWGASDDAIWTGSFPLTNECYVGWEGGDSYHGAYWAVGGIKTYDIPTGRTLGWNGSDYYQDYPGGALGTFHIYKNSTDENNYLRFKPSSYILRTGSDGTSWTSSEMTVSATNSHYYETAELDLTSTLISEHAYVDLKTSSGHVWCNFSNDRTASGNVKVKSSVGDADGNFRGTNLQAGDAGTHGKFRIDITKDVDNWKLAFVPMYRITYAAGTGALGSMDPSSYAEISTTIATIAEGFTDPTGKEFNCWSDGVNTYAVGDNVTMNSNVTLTAQWKDIDYTVTVNQSPSVGATTTGQTSTAHYNGTINLTVTDIPSGYRFVNWTSSDVTITNPTSATTASFTMPAKNVTVTANFQQTHTVSWKYNGADYVSPVTYDHGGTLVLPTPNPTAPSGCSSKVFVGWTSDPEITTAISTAPTFISAGGAVNTDATYRAVFADEEDDEVTYSYGWEADPSSTDWEVSYITRSNAQGYPRTDSYGGKIQHDGEAYIKLKHQISPTSVSCYYTKTSTNTNQTSAFALEYWVDDGNGGGYWDGLAMGRTMNNVTQGTWYELSWSGDDKTDTYVRVVYNGTNATRALDDLVIVAGGTSYDNYITVCSSCETPSSLSMSAITSTGGEVSWSGVSLSPTEGFKVAWNTSNSVPSPLNGTNSADVDADKSEYSITGLTPATQYYVFVQSKCNSTWSSSTNFYTNAKITYAANGGLGSMDPKEVTYNAASTTVDACTFDAPSGKTFNGWVSNVAVTVNGGGSPTTTVPAGATINNLTAAITLTAQWRDLASYTVHYSANNGTIAGGADQIVYENGTLTFPNVTPTCGEFIGWIESSSYSSSTMPSGATFHLAGDEIAVTAALDGKTYYAVYSEETAPEPTDDYVKIENEQTDWSGDYLIVSEYTKDAVDYSKAFNGSLATLDASGNNVAVTITSKTIESNSTTDSYKFTIAKVAGQPGKYSIKSASGYYIGNGGTGNALSSNTTLSSTYYNTISYNTANSRVHILGNNASPTRLAFNSNTGVSDNRFRYYSAPDGQKNVQLYKKGGGSVYTYKTSPSCSPTVSTSTPASSFTYVYGNGPSDSQSFQVSGSNLSTNLVVAAPSNYQVSTDNSTFSNSVNVAPTDGKVTSTTIYIRLVAGLNVGSYNGGVITVSSTGADDDVSGALTGSVTKAAGAIAFTNFNAVDHYEAEMAAGASSVDVTLTVSVTGDGAVSYSRSPAAGSSAVPATTPTTTLHVTTVGTWTVTANLAAGSNYTSASTSCQVVVYYADRFYDNLHGNTTIVKRNGDDGNPANYNIPSLSDEARETSGSCSETHYHFMGWVPESALSTLSDDAAYTAVMITGGGTQAASGTNYYAVWAEE